MADHNLGSEAGYVGLSRGTHANHLYLLAGDDPRSDDTCFPARQRPMPSERDLGVRDQVMRHSRQQQLAIRRLAEGRGR